MKYNGGTANLTRRGEKETMRFQKLDPSEVFVVYVDIEGEEYVQPISDIANEGILTDPETGDDMEIIRVGVRIS